jgi:D-tyrosyl-tRNA(Tyr) deacylase
MRAVIQRVTTASVWADGRVISQIDRGLLVYLSVGRQDEDKGAEFIAEKLTGLRIFADEAGKTRLGEGAAMATEAIVTPSRSRMNRSVQDVGGQILLVSNFTLYGDCRKGRRPGFDAASGPTAAQRLYEKTAQLIADKGVKVSKGVFGAYMQVTSVNDGPVTFLLDSSRLF